MDHLIARTGTQNTNVLLLGHRGWRGNYPENTIYGLKKAFELGVDGVEIDVVINKDGNLVLSHEPWMNPKTCTPGGKHYNIFELTQDEISTFDCGIKPYPDFPHQEKIAVSKPLFREVIDQLDWTDKLLFLEIKSLPDGDGIYHPEPASYVQSIINEFEGVPYTGKVYFMSFDVRILKEIIRQRPYWKTVFLFEELVDELNFSPTAVGPHHDLLNEKNMEAWSTQGLEVYAWTVNELEDIRKCENLKVSGIISDYPNRLFG